MNTLTMRPAAALSELVTAVRAAVARNADWGGTASYVADALRRHLPPPELLSADQLAGERGTCAVHRLHVEPDGSFSMVAIVWQPGALTRIHDHVTWCVFGVLAGMEYEDLYTLSGDSTAISLHIYGTDLDRIGTSARRYYDLPVRPRTAEATEVATRRTEQ